MRLFCSCMSLNYLRTMGIELKSVFQIVTKSSAKLKRNNKHLETESLK